MSSSEAKIDLQLHIDPEQIIKDYIRDDRRQKYLLNIFDKFRALLTSGEFQLRANHGTTITTLLTYAAFDLSMGSALLSNAMIKKLDDSDPTKFYADYLTAWIWAVDHSSKGDFNKKAAQELVRLTLERADTGQITGASDGRVHLLEVGCAHGRDYHYLARKNPRVHYLGLDISPAMITIAKILNPDGDFRVGDILNLQDSVSEKQAAVFAAAVLHHFDDQTKPGVIGQFRDVLADNGLLFLSLRSGDGPQKDEETGLTYHALTQDDMTALLRERGFNILNSCITGSPRGVQYINMLSSAKPRIVS